MNIEKSERESPSICDGRKFAETEFFYSVRHTTHFFSMVSGFVPPHPQRIPVPPPSICTPAPPKNLRPPQSRDAEGVRGCESRCYAKKMPALYGKRKLPKRKMVPRGLEPRTLRLLAVRSDQLSYETWLVKYCKFRFTSCRFVSTGGTRLVVEPASGSPPSFSPTDLPDKLIVELIQTHLENPTSFSPTGGTRLVVEVSTTSSNPAGTGRLSPELPVGEKPSDF